MRDYALQCAAASGNIGTSPFGLIRNWLQRRRMKSLVSSADAEFQALDITADDLQWALRLPLNVDIRQALDDRKFRRARSLCRF